jgi:DNA repair protein RadC
MYVAELTKKRYRGRRPQEVKKPEDAVQILRQRFRHAEGRELFVLLLLDTRNEVLGIETISVGTLNASIVHPREVFRPAIAAGAASILVAHNHPSGNPAPSEDDLEITKRLVKAGDLVGIPVLDHLILGKRRFLSLKQEGHLK